MSGQSPGIHCSQVAGGSLADGISALTGMEVEDLDQVNRVSLKRGRGVNFSGQDTLLQPNGLPKEPASPDGGSNIKVQKTKERVDKLDKDVVLDDSSVRHVTIMCTDPGRSRAMA